MGLYIYKYVFFKNIIHLINLINKYKNKKYKNIKINLINK